jgi:glycosyltransferase involved in cell wall biosynthesis
MKKILIIPAFNEGKTIAKVVEGSLPFVDQIIVVDDGSQDDTAQLASQAGATVYRHPKNRGAGAATITGLKASIEHNGDIMITCDADGQHVLEDIPKIVNCLLENNVDVVSGSRLISPVGMPLIRVVYNKIANIVTFIFFGLWVTDSQSGFKCFTKEAVLKMNLKSNGWEICSEIIKEIKNKKLKFREYPIKVLYTQYSMSKGQNLFNGIKTFWRLLLNREIK